jgi:hypothetical protein
LHGKEKDQSRPRGYEQDYGVYGEKLGLLEPMTEMGRQVAVVLYVALMAAVVVGIDVLFFRNRVWERLTVNIGIVLVFAAFYLRFLKSQ